MKTKKRNLLKKIAGKKNGEIKKMILDNLRGKSAKGGEK